MPFINEPFGEEENTAAERARFEEESRGLEEHIQKMRHQDLRPHLALRKLRKSLRNDDGKKISQREMAEFLGMSLRGYQNYEHGDRPIPSDVLTKIKAYFEASAEALFSHLVVGSDVEKLDSLVDEVLDLTFDLLARYSALKPDELRRVVKDAIGQRDQDRVIYQDPDIDFDHLEIQQSIRRESKHYRVLLDPYSGETP